MLNPEHTSTRETSVDLEMPSITDQEEKDESQSPIVSQDVEKAHPQAQSNAPLDWDGDDDPENPWNWSLRKRIFHIIPPAVISFTATFGSSIYSPAVTSIVRDFGVSTTVAILPLSFYVLALGSGPMLAAPISETYGRHIVYLLSAPLGSLFTLGAGFSNDIGSLCVTRFFAGLFYSPALAIGAGTIADVLTPEHRSFTVFYLIMPFLGPALGPVIGSFVVVRKSWRWTQWTMIFFSIASFISILFMKETYKKTILARRAKKLGIPPPPSPFPNALAKIKFLMNVTLIRPVHMLFTEPLVGFLSLYVAFNFSILFAFFAAFPYIFESQYNFGQEDVGLTFLAIGVGCLLAVPTVLICDRVFWQAQFRLSHTTSHPGVVPPEYRLYPAIVGAFGIPISLFWFAWTARTGVSWASPVVAAVPFGWGNLCVFTGSAMYLVDTYAALNGASAMAANGLLRYVLGAAFPLFTLQMYRGLGIDWATSLLGFISIVLTVVPFVLFRYGPKLRSRSSYDTIKA